MARGRRTSRWLAGICLGLGFAAFTGPAVAQTPEGPVKIGALVDLESTYADIGGMGAVEAVRMAVEDAGGSVLGKPIEVVFASSQNKADIASNIARQWFDSGVDVVTDLPTSAVALAVMNLATQKKKIALVTAAGSSDITGKACSPYAAHWTWDTYAMSKGTGEGIAKAGKKDWFFLTADYVFGHTLERDTASVVTARGSRVVGSARHPLGTNDFSSFLLQAQAAKPQILGLANAGTDMINTIKQASEFGIRQSGIKLVALVAFLSDVHSLGLKDAQGLLLTEAFYWDQDDATRAWSQRFFKRMKKMPSMTQAGAYSATAHYLKVVKALGTKDPDKVMAEMRRTPIEDFMTRGGQLRTDGRVVRDMYLFEVKRPEESKSEWDLYRTVSTIPGNEAFRPQAEGGCPTAR